MSLSIGEFILVGGDITALFKEVLVCPLFKKPLLDPTILDKFCPVSHFPNLGKVVEKMVVLQFQMILEDTDYPDPFHSSFRPGYGIQMALVHS